MAVIFESGEVMFCETVECGRRGFLVDGHLYYPTKEIIRIVKWEE